MENPSDKDLGGLQIPPAGGPPAGNGASINDASVSAQTVRARKERSDKGLPRKPREGSGSGSVPTLSQSQFAALYDPKIWAKALSAPADAMAAMTGKPHWELSQTERDNLGATGAIAAQCFAVSDPRYLAVSLALITILDTYGLRLAKDWADAKAKKQEEEKKRKDIYQPQNQTKQ